MKRKVIGMLLVFCMCVSLLAGVTVPASAATSGTCGTNLTWNLDGNGVLTISGTGAMEDYEFYSAVPWCNNTTSVKTVIIEDGVTSIGNIAFASCYYLTEITIPNSVTSIGSSAFYQCDSLTEITIPNSVTSIGSSAFSQCNALTTITIPNGVTSIGDSVFHGCTTLSTITIPDSVLTIGDYAFSNCTALTEIIIPNSVTSIGDYAFYGCEFAEIIIPDSVKSIGRSAFHYCEALTEIVIPDSVTSIGRSAFYNCKALTKITISDSVTIIEESAFYNCKALATITIPDSVTSIRHSAFDNCTSLTDVYYGGAETDRSKISIGIDNDSLADATWHYQKSEGRLSTVDGAQIRTTGAQGLRFISTIEKSEDFSRVVEYGTLLIPSADITDISELVIDATLNGHTVAKVKANYLYAEDDETVTFTAVITDIAEKNYAREYTARAYAILDDGSVVYADAGASRSIYAVAKRGLENPDESDANKGIFQTIVDAVKYGDNDAAWPW